MNPAVSDLTAIFFAVVGFTCWVLADSCIKWIGQFNAPPDEIVAFMGFLMSLALALQAAVRRRCDSLRPRSVLPQVMRALLDMTNNVCIVVALRHLSLTLFYILIFTSPMVIAVLSALFLDERITFRQEGRGPGRRLPRRCDRGRAVRQRPSHRPDRRGQLPRLRGLVFREHGLVARAHRTEPPESLAFCSGVVTAIAGAALASLHPRPLTPTVWLATAVMGVQSKYSRGSAVVSKQAAEALSTSDASATAGARRGGEEQDVSFALMVSLGVVMRDIFGQRPFQRAFTEENRLGKALLLH